MMKSFETCSEDFSHVSLGTCICFSSWWMHLEWCKSMVCKNRSLFGQLSHLEFEAEWMKKMGLLSSGGDYMRTKISGSVDCWMLGLAMLRWTNNTLSRKWDRVVINHGWAWHPQFRNTMVELLTPEASDPCPALL